MNHLRIDGPILDVIETQSSVHPVWYHGDVNIVLYAFNSIKEAILVNNVVLYEEISLAKRSHDNHGISKLFVTREYLVNLFSDKYDESDDAVQNDQRNTF